MEKKRIVDEKSKDEQLKMFREDPEREFLTTNQGVRVSNTDISLKAGERGPTLLEDFHFREKITHFDHVSVHGVLQTVISDVACLVCLSVFSSRMVGSSYCSL